MHAYYITVRSCLAVYHAVAPMDYVSTSDLSLKFEECDTRSCLNVTVNNDMTLEKAESFYIFGSVNFNYHVIPYHAGFYGQIKIMDDDECKNLYT